MSTKMASERCSLGDDKMDDSVNGNMNDPADSKLKLR